MFPCGMIGQRSSKKECRPTYLKKKRQAAFLIFLPEITKSKEADTVNKDFGVVFVSQLQIRS